MTTFTANMLKDLAYFYTNTDRSALETAGLIQPGKSGDHAWERFNHNFDIFILKLSDEDRAVLAAMATDYAKSFEPEVDSDAEKLKKAGEAIAYLLNRSQHNDKLYYHIGFGTESFRQLCAAHAALTGAPSAEVEKRYSR